MTQPRQQVTVPRPECRHQHHGHTSGNGMGPSRQWGEVRTRSSSTTWSLQEHLASTLESGCRAQEATPSPFPPPRPRGGMVVGGGGAADKSGESTAGRSLRMHQIGRAHIGLVNGLDRSHKHMRKTKQPLGKREKHGVYCRAFGVRSACVLRAYQNLVVGA